MQRLELKVGNPTVAIKLHNEVLGVPGQWLLIMPDETVQVLDDAEVKAAYRIHSEPSPVPSPPKKPAAQRASRTKSPSYHVTLAGKDIRLGGQLGRVLVALAKRTNGTGSGRRSSDLRAAMDVDDCSQITARLSDARNRGLVAAARSAEQYDRSFEWSLTDDGREIVRQIEAQHDPFGSRF